MTQKVIPLRPVEPEPARVPPSDLEAERACLSLAMVSREALQRLTAILVAEDFASEAHRWIFQACLEIYERGDQADVVTVMGWLKDEGRLGRVGGSVYVTDTLNAAPGTANLVRYATTVRNKARVRETLKVAQRIVAGAYVPHGDDSEWLACSVSDLSSAARTSDAEALTGNADALATIVREVHRAAAAGSAITGIATGIDRYDRLTLGLHAGQLTIVAARPGVGKTAFAGSACRTIVDRNVGVLFVSLEMTREELLFREISRRTRIDATMLKLGQLSGSQWGAFHRAAVEVGERPLWIDDRAGLTVQQIRERVLGALDECKAKKHVLGVVVVDYLQKVAVPQEQRRRQRYEQVGAIVSGLKKLARDARLPVVALAQLRRLRKGEAERNPTFDDLRESGDIEQEADVVALLHRPQRDKPSAEIIVAKARGGREGVVSVAWRPELTLFENLAEGGAP
jgi:replicative DNA helicase